MSLLDPRLIKRAHASAPFSFTQKKTLLHQILKTSDSSLCLYLISELWITITGRLHPTAHRSRPTALPRHHRRCTDLHSHRRLCIPGSVNRVKRQSLLRPTTEVVIVPFLTTRPQLLPRLLLVSQNCPPLICGNQC